MIVTPFGSVSVCDLNEEVGRDSSQSDAASMQDRIQKYVQEKRFALAWACVLDTRFKTPPQQQGECQYSIVRAYMKERWVNLSGAFEALCLLSHTKDIPDSDYRWIAIKAARVGDARVSDLAVERITDSGVKREVIAYVIKLER